MIGRRMPVSILLRSSVGIALAFPKSQITDQEHVTKRLACLIPRSYQTSLQSIWVSYDLIRAIHHTCA
jgi:hypothetical protein